MDTNPKPLAVGEHPPHHPAGGPPERPACTPGGRKVARLAATPAQSRLLRLMREGRRLWWFGGAGPELEGHPFWPQKRTVRALLKAGRLRWLPCRNDTQCSCGICELEAA